MKLRPGNDGVAASYYPLSALAIDDGVIFPAKSPAAAREVENAYRTLWAQFVAEHALLPTRDFDAYFHGLYYLLFKYAWCVPSAFYRDVPDISLFDHSRTTSAIATALASQGLGETDLDALIVRNRETWDEPVFALIGGDLSGIQKFLYTLTSAGAARGLRGRSFYLQLLTDTVARWILSRLGLSICNVLYCGGGRFYILAPAKAREALPALRAELSRVLLEAHGAELYLALDSVELAPSNLSFQTERRNEDFGSMWEKIGEQLSQAKRRKFAELGPDELHSRMFSARGSGGFARTCEVCRAEISGDEASESRKCSVCESLEDLGQELRDARYLVVTSADEPAQGPRTWRSSLAGFGAAYTVCRDEHALRKALAGQVGAQVLSLGNSDFLPVTKLSKGPAGVDLSLGFSLYLPVAPRESGGGVADFSTIAERSRGVKRLGILRMDVDDLGQIFGKGLGQRGTPSRLSSLSLLMRVFFEGWVPKLCAEINESTDGGQVYPIYSGGDDLLLVGSWSAIPDLATAIRRDFARFVAGNPDIHLSAGVALEPKKFPLYQAAEHAREALDDRAKARTVEGHLAKDAVDFLGQTLGWDEFARAAEMVERLTKLIEAKEAPRALVHTIGAIYQHYEATASQGRAKKVYFGRWMWLAAYSLTRMAERARSSAKQDIKNMQAELLDPTGITIAGLAARWTELLLREGD